MATTVASRKPIDKITTKDLDAFPIWEFATDEEDIEGRDETWIRPVKAKVVPPDAYSLSVAADYQTASGKALTGIVGVTTAGGLEFGHGALLMKGAYLFVPASDYSGAKTRERPWRKALECVKDRFFHCVLRSGFVYMARGRPVQDSSNESAF
jgi:hypothetical protein